MGMTLCRNLVHNMTAFSCQTGTNYIFFIKKVLNPLDKKHFPVCERPQKETYYLGFRFRLLSIHINTYNPRVPSSTCPSWIYQGWMANGYRFNHFNHYALNDPSFFGIGGDSVSFFEIRSKLHNHWYRGFVGHVTLGNLLGHAPIKQPRSSVW